MNYGQTTSAHNYNGGSKLPIKGGKLGLRVEKWSHLANT